MSALFQSIASTLGNAGGGYAAARDSQTAEKNALDQQNSERAMRLRSFLAQQQTADLQRQVELARLAAEQHRQQAPPKGTWRVEMGSDGKAHDILYDDTTGESIHDAGVHYEPTKAEPAARTTWKVDTIQGVPHDVLYDSQGNVVKIGGVHYERPEKDGKLTPAQSAAQYNQLVSTFKYHLSQAVSALNQASSQKSSHPIYSRLGLLGTDPAQAKSQQERASKALAYVLSQREAVKTGKADMQDVSDKAQSMLDGGDQTGPSTTVSNAPTASGGAVPIPGNARIGHH